MNGLNGASEHVISRVNGKHYIWRTQYNEQISRRQDYFSFERHFNYISQSIASAIVCWLLHINDINNYLLTVQNNRISWEGFKSKKLFSSCSVIKNFQQTLWPQGYGCTVKQPRESFCNLRFLQHTRVTVLPLLLNVNCFFLHSVAKYNSMSLLMLCYFQVIQYFSANVKVFLFKANISLL